MLSGHPVGAIITTNMNTLLDAGYFIVWHTVTQQLTYN